MSIVTESQVKDLLTGSKDQKINQLSKDTALVKSLSKVLTTTIKMSSDPLPVSLINKGISLSGVGEKTSGSNGLKTANFVTGQTMKTIGMTKILGMTPPKAAAYMTLAVAEKIVAAAGMGEVDKCKMAIASLTLTTGMGAFACAGTLGVGCLAGAIAIAADAFDVYGQCSAPPPGISKS